MGRRTRGHQKGAIVKLIPLQSLKEMELEYQRRLRRTTYSWALLALYVGAALLGTACVVIISEYENGADRNAQVRQMGY